MGYTTEFEGQIAVEPPLNEEEIAYLKKFSHTRRMLRRNGEYFVDGSGDFGQGHDGDVIEYNRPPLGQPGLWCNWVPTDDGRFIKWNGAEKFYYSEEWMRYLIEHFLAPEHKAPMSFLQGHTLNGEILAQGEDIEDRWKLIVKDNIVSTAQLP